MSCKFPKSKWPVNHYTFVWSHLEGIVGGSVATKSSQVIRKLWDRYTQDVGREPQVSDLTGAGANNRNL